MNAQKTVFLATLASLGVISASLCAPALPCIADHFAATFSSVQFAISLFLAGNGLGQFFSGPLSDKFGQNKIMLCGLFLYLLASLSAALSWSMTSLMLSRFFQGMGCAVGPVLARAIASSTTSGLRAAQVQSYGAMGIGVASILSILCSGQLTFVSWRANFVLAALLGLILFLWAFFAQERVCKNIQSHYKLFSGIKQVCKKGSFVRPLLCHSFTYGLMYAYIALFPFLLMELFAEKNPASVGSYSALMILCYMGGTFLAARLVSHIGRDLLIVVGLLVQLISGLLFLTSNDVLFVFTALSLFNMSIGLILPMTTTSALAHFGGTSTGLASSLLGTGYRLIGSCVSMGVCLFPFTKCVTLCFSIVLLSLLALPIAFVQYQKTKKMGDVVTV